MTGSHHLQVPWLDTGEGRTLEQLPFAYIVSEKIWAPVNQTFLMPPELKDYYAVGAWNGAAWTVTSRRDARASWRETAGIRRSPNSELRVRRATAKARITSRRIGIRSADSKCT